MPETSMKEVFNAISENVKWQLKHKTLKGDVVTNKRAGFTIIQNGEWEERYPEFPNWNEIENAVAKLNNAKEEQSIRNAMEYGRNLEFNCRKFIHEFEEEQDAYVKLVSDEKISRIFVKVGKISETDVEVKQVDPETGKEFFVPVNLEGMPYYEVVSSPEGKDLALFEHVHFKKKVRQFGFLEWAERANFWNAMCMMRLGITKSRLGWGVEKMNEERSYTTVQSTPLPEDANAQKSGGGGLGGIFPQ